jgi:hypothetical protein
LKPYRCRGSYHTFRAIGKSKGVSLIRFIEACNPVQDALIESLNWKFSDEGLKQNWIVSLDYARRINHRSVGRIKLAGVPQCYI